MRSVAFLVALVLVPSAARAFDVTSCGQTVPARETGFLQADLSCPTGVGVHVAERATLDLNGHALAAAADSAIVCDARKCRILGTGNAPGDVSGTPDVDCIAMPTPRGKLVLDNVTVHDCRTCIETNPLGAHGYGANVFANAVGIDGCAGPGIDARQVRATGVTVAHAQDIALWSEMKLKGDGIDVSDNTGIGIFSVSISADDVVADRNGSYGVESFGPMRIRGGEMLDNGSWDVVAGRAKLTGVTCGRSWHLGSQPPSSLGACTND